MNQQKLKEILAYCPITGLFTWKLSSSNRVRVGDTAGTINRGYRNIKVAGVLYRAPHLVFLYMVGYLPSTYIDHINGDRDDNSWGNLREVSVTENNKNSSIGTRNTSGILGVSWIISKQKWRARITVNGKKKFLGYFDDLNIARTARKEAEALYGFHQNHGRNKT